MTLAELVDLTCLKCHRTDEQTRAEVRAYVSARYKMIWESRPWRDSLGMLTIPAESVSRIMILPGIVDRLQAVRWGDAETLRAQDLGVTMNIDPASFERMGTPALFSLVSPSATQASPAGSAIKVFSSDSNASGSVSIRGMSGNNERSERLLLAGTGEIPSVHAYDEILSLSKDTQSYDLTVQTATGTELLFLDALETNRAFQRVQFHADPAGKEKPLLILFKRRFRPLVADADATELTGIDNALLAAAIADVLEGQRQFGKAQAKMGEASTMTQNMADLERHQSASGATLVPWDAAMSDDACWRD